MLTLLTHLLRLAVAIVGAVALIVFAAVSPAFAAEASDLSGAAETPVSTSWALIAGVLTPLLTSLVQQPQWTNRTRSLVGVAVAIVIGILTCLAQGTLDLIDTQPENVLATLALVLVASQAAYQSLWKMTGIAPAIERATSKNPPYPPDPSGHSPAEPDATRRENY